MLLNVHVKAMTRQCWQKFTHKHCILYSHAKFASALQIQYMQVVNLVVEPCWAAVAPGATFLITLIIAYLEAWAQSLSLRLYTLWCISLTLQHGRAVVWAVVSGHRTPVAVVESTSKPTLPLKRDLRKCLKKRQKKRIHSGQEKA